MEYFEKDFGKILKNNAQQQRHELLPQGTDCFRVYDRNLSQFPVTVDIYGKYARVVDFGDTPMDDDRKASCLDICSRMLYLDKDNVVYTYRAKRAWHEQHEKSGDDAPVVTTVSENGLRFRVDLSTYADTGLFLDHRKTREMIRDRSAGCEVLNLFSYTGSFSVYAAAGLAKSVTSVDISNTYTNWAVENLSENGYDGDNYRCVSMDARVFVSQAIENNRKYDIIIFDPPSFSNSRKMDGDFDVARDYPQWIGGLSSILKKTGVILFSTNLGTFRMDRRRLRGLTVREITGAVQASGFVRDRLGTVRSWMMAFDEESLSLDWSEPKEKSVKSSDDQTEKSERGERRSYSDRKPYGEKKSYGDRKPYGERRSYGDRKPYGERKSYGERKPYGERRSYERSDDRESYGDRKPYGERRSYGDRPRFDRSERPYRSREEGSDRSERYERSERYDRSDRFERGDRPERRERTDRPFRSERSSSYGEKRSFNRDDRQDRQDRPFRSERRSFDRKPYGDRQYGDKPYGERRSFRDGQEGDRKPQTRRNDSGKKPYGFDSFKPARSRNDSTDFFWNSEDLDKKKKED